MPTAPRRLPDLVDGVAVAGLALLWYGLAEIWAPLGPTVVGALLTLLAAVLAFRRRSG